MKSWIKGGLVGLGVGLIILVAALFFVGECFGVSPECMSLDNGERLCPQTGYNYCSTYLVLV